MMNTRMNHTPVPTWTLRIHDTRWNVLQETTLQGDAELALHEAESWFREEMSAAGQTITVTEEGQEDLLYHGDFGLAPIEM